MQTNVVQGRLALARVKFEPVACMLDHLAKDIEKEHGRVVLQQRSPMESTAQNVCSVRYFLRYPDDVRLALTFIVTGEIADLLLLQAQERSGPRNMKANSGPVDQRVYRVEEVEDIKQAVQEKIRAHLWSRRAQDTGRVAH